MFPKTNPELQRNRNIIIHLNLGALAAFIAICNESLLGACLSVLYMLGVILCEWSTLETVALIALTCLTTFAQGSGLAVLSYSYRSASVLFGGVAIGLIIAYTGAAEYAQTILYGIYLGYAATATALFTTMVQLQRTMHTNVRAPLRPGKKEVTPERSDEFTIANRNAERADGRLLFIAIALAQPVFTTIAYKFACDFLGLTTPVEPLMDFCHSNVSDFYCEFKNHTAHLVNTMHFIHQAPYWESSDEASLSANFAKLPPAVRSILILSTGLASAIFVIRRCREEIYEALPSRATLRAAALRNSPAAAIVVLISIIAFRMHAAAPHSGTSHPMWPSGAEEPMVVMAALAIVAIAVGAWYRARKGSMFPKRREPAADTKQNEPKAKRAAAKK
jgi:hypothetical protein